MQHRHLGQGLDVSALGLGCTGMSANYREPQDTARTDRQDLQQLDAVRATINVHGARGTGQESYA